VPPLDPLSRLLDLAASIGAFAAEMERRTDLDTRLLRGWEAEAGAIAVELQRQGATRQAAPGAASGGASSS
jgi:hypothetical protein